MASETSGDGAVLVCGLGSLGIECVFVLRGYGVPVRAIELGGATCPDVDISRGDCRDAEVLRRAGIAGCRAVVLVTGDSRINIETALAARRLNAAVRIVARASQDNINHLLTSLVGNFVAYEPSRLAAGALALAAARGEVIGSFRIEKGLVRVLRRRIEVTDSWHGVAVKELARQGVIILDHLPGSFASRPPSAGQAPTGGARLQEYDLERLIAEGDELTTLSVDRNEVPRPAARVRTRRSPGDLLRGLRRSLRRPAGIVLASLAFIGVALGVSALAFPSGEHELSAIDGVFTALVLMTGGTYADLFPPFHHLSNRLRLLSVVLSATGTVFVGLLYAWLTERVVSLRLRLGKRRPPVPHGGHVVVVGLGRIGRRASSMYQELAYPVAAIEKAPVEGHALPGLPIVAGNGVDEDTLTAANVAGARAVLAATRDEWVNLEIALQVRRLNAQCEVVIRTQDTRFAENIAGVIPGMQALCVPAIAARAFAAAALGGQVLELFQVSGRTVYAFEHEVRTGDGLDGRSLAEAAEGYAIVPVWYVAGGRPSRFWSPTDKAVRLAGGDRVVMLGPSDSLQRIARREARPREVTLRLIARRPYAESLAVAALLVQHTGATLEDALRLVGALPHDLPAPLYPHQAQRLKAELEASGVSVELALATAEANAGSVSSDAQPAT